MYNCSPGTLYLPIYIHAHIQILTRYMNIHTLLHLSPPLSLSLSLLLPQVAVLREGWAYSMWMPMCSQSALLHASKCQALVYLNLTSPLMSRDSTLCVYAVDLTDEGSVLFLSDPEGLPHIPRPPVPKGFGAGRMDIRDFRFKYVHTFSFEHDSFISLYVCMAMHYIAGLPCPSHLPLLSPSPLHL
jgi:hypothetical protein